MSKRQEDQGARLGVTALAASGSPPPPPPTKGNMLDIGRRVLAAQPFSVLIGAELRELADGHAELRVPLRPDLLQQDGFVHGGVISYASDNAITFAAGSVLGTGVLTSGSRIDYLRPARGQSLIARATVEYTGRSHVVCRCDVFVSDQGEERLCAITQGTVAVRSQEAMRD